MPWRLIAAVALVAAVALAGWSILRPEAGEALAPDGIVFGNGRIEADQVDVAARHPGRVVEVLAVEGGMVEAGDLLARMDVAELEAERARAEAEAAFARERRAEAEALVAQRESELSLAEHELVRAGSLRERGVTPEATYERAESARAVARAALVAARAGVATAERGIDAAEAGVRRIEAQIEDARLTAPVAGRVLYRLAEPGEVVAAGAPVITLLSLEDVYMEIFLPAGAAARLPLGAEARIVLDALPDYAVPALVSFVSPEAQFTPRQVETLEEREKLVFKVRVRVPPDLVRGRIAQVKTGVRGVAYARLDPGVDWPERLQRRIPPELLVAN